MVSTGSAAAVCSRKLGWDRQGDMEENISETVKTNQTVNHVCSHFQTRPRCIALKSLENKCTHYYNRYSLDLDDNFVFLNLFSQL